MMTREPVSPHNGFKVRIREIFWKRSPGSQLIRFAANSPVYTSGQNDATVYLIESGRVKLVLPTLEGTNCLLAIRTAGDIFGELCLSDDAVRRETAIAMEDTVLRRISRSNFMTDLKQKPDLRPLYLHLASCVSEQQQVAATLTSETDEQRVAEFLLRLGWDAGGDDSCTTRSDQRLSQSDLAEMVGTTRGRIGAFFKKFRALGLISVNSRGRLVVWDDRLSDYVARSTFGAEIEADLDRRQSSACHRPDDGAVARARNSAELLHRRRVALSVS
jgi:CRP/FNR family transcriptional regulator, cyclic AMP receptor protein